MSRIICNKCGATVPKYQPSCPKCYSYDLSEVPDDLPEITTRVVAKENDAVSKKKCMCNDCGYVFDSQKGSCPKCYSDDFEEVLSSDETDNVVNKTKTMSNNNSSMFSKYPVNNTPTISKDAKSAIIWIIIAICFAVLMGIAAYNKEDKSKSNNTGSTNNNSDIIPISVASNSQLSSSEYSISQIDIHTYKSSDKWIDYSIKLKNLDNAEHRFYIYLTFYDKSNNELGSSYCNHNMNSLQESTLSDHITITTGISSKDIANVKLSVETVDNWFMYKRI